MCSRGRRTSANEAPRGCGNPGGVGVEKLLERVARRRRDVWKSDARDRRLQMTEPLLSRETSDFGTDPAFHPRGVDRYDASRFLEGLENDLFVHRFDGPQVNHFGADTLRCELGRCL